MASEYRGVESFVTRASAATGNSQHGSAPGANAAAMDDDLRAPQVLAVIHETTRDGNRSPGARGMPGAACCFSEARAMLGILGLDPLTEQGAPSRAGERFIRVANVLAEVVLRQRQAARDRKILRWRTP
jgi:cysteinyl-tRNA synthetase